MSNRIQILNDKTHYYYNDKFNIEKKGNPIINLLDAGSKNNSIYEDDSDDEICNYKQKYYKKNNKNKMYKFKFDSSSEISDTDSSYSFSSHDEISSDDDEYYDRAEKRNEKYKKRNKKIKTFCFSDDDDDMSQRIFDDLNFLREHFVKNIVVLVKKVEINFKLHPYLVEIPSIIIDVINHNQYLFEIKIEHTINLYSDVKVKNIKTLISDWEMKRIDFLKYKFPTIYEKILFDYDTKNKNKNNNNHDIEIKIENTIIIPLIGANINDYNGKKQQEKTKINNCKKIIILNLVKNN